MAAGLGGSLGGGLRRLASAPGLLAVVWLLNLAFALPFAVTVGQSIQESIGQSRVHEQLEAGFDDRWFGEYQAAARGIETLLEPTLVGPGAFFENLEAWWTGDLLLGDHSLPPVLVAAGLAYALLWVFLTAGIVARFGGRGSDGLPAGFLAGAGRYAFRYLRLALLAAPLYYGIYRFGRWLFALLEGAMADVTSELTALSWTLGLALFLVLLLGIVRAAFDYAKVLTVVEERKSALLAALGGFGFLARQPLRALGAAWLPGLLTVLALVLYALVAPGAAVSTWPGVVLALLLGQGMILLRLAVRLLTLGAEVSLVEGITGRRAA